MLGGYSQVFFWWALSVVYAAEPDKANKDRFPEIADAIAITCESNPTCATRLASIFHYESTMTVGAVGDHGSSCGLGQTQCGLTPKDVLGQVQLAATRVEQSISKCGDLTLYTSGQCGRGKIAADRRESLARRLLNAPQDDRD